jgi:uncharacterized cofD-like protein
MVQYETQTESDAPYDIVVIGGGTGNSTVLQGLKPYAGEGLTAVVNTFDDGGGTGKLRTEYGGIAVGDLRQCLRAQSSLDADVLDIMEDRWGEGSGASGMNLKGQVPGNLLIDRAFRKHAGDPDRAIRAVSRLYQIKGKVLPVSHDSSRLTITLPDGQQILGEHNAEMTELPTFKGARLGFDNGGTTLSEEAEAAIESADMVVLGDLYTSIGPNLVVKGMKEAIERAKAVVMVANLMNRGRHTVGFNALDYAREYERMIGARVIDRVIYNTESLDPVALAEQARKTKSHPVEPNVAGLEMEGYRPYGADLLSHNVVMPGEHDELGGTRSEIRHDPRKVASAIIGVYHMNGFAHED